MKLSLDLGYLAAAVACFVIGFFTLTGDTQTVINFTDPLGDLVFCVFAILGGLFLTTAAIYNGKK